MICLYSAALKPIIDATPLWAEDFWLKEVDVWGKICGGLVWLVGEEEVDF